jgi:hypothetical protein
MSEDINPSAVSVERDGRILSGGPGTDVAALERTMDRHAPETSEATPESGATPATDRPDSSQPEPRGRARFTKLTGERDEAKKAADAATQRAADLEARLAAIEARQQQVRETKPEPAPVPRQPEPQTDEERLEARIRTAAREEARREFEEKEASRAMNDRMFTMRTSAREIYPDFDTVLKDGPGAKIPLAADDQIGAERVNMLVHLEGGQHALYHISKDAALAQRLSQMSDREFGFAIARLLPADASVVSPASTGIPRAVTAPPPYQPVGSGSKTTALPSSALVSKAGFDFDKSGYREKRAAERGVRRR